jgi:hypothetical protein
VLETPKIFSSHLDNLNQNLGCPKNCLVVQSNPQSGLVHLACELVLTVEGAAKGPQKLWGKWCKILHSGHILAQISASNSMFFLPKFLLDKAPRSSGLKGAKICNLAISVVFYGARIPLGNLF